MPLVIVYDKGPENQGVRKELLKRCKVRNAQVAVYHPQSNRLGEYGHWNSLDSLVKLTAPWGNPGNWPAYLPAVSCAVRNAVHKSTEMRPCRVVFGQKCLLPVEIAMENWPMVDWLGVERAGNKRVELAALRARQLEERP